MYLDVEVNPKRPRVKSNAVSEGDDHTLQDKSEFGGLPMEEIYLVFGK